MNGDNLPSTFDRDCYNTPMDDAQRHSPPFNDAPRRVTLDVVAARFAQAGLPRSIRSLQRYCQNGTLDCVKEATLNGDNYFVDEHSIDPAIIQMRQIHEARQGATPSSATPLVVALDPSDQASDDGRQVPSPADIDARSYSNAPGQFGTTGDAGDVATAGHVAQLEKRLTEKDDEIEFLRGEVRTKNQQLADTSERDRETNILIQGLQSLVLQLTGNDASKLLPGPTENDETTPRRVHVQDVSEQPSGADFEPSRATPETTMPDDEQPSSSLA